jgi:hypothetical protein
MKNVSIINTCTCIIYLTPSKMLATANSVEGEISDSFFLMALTRLSAVSWRPTDSVQKRSVFAVHRTIILSRPDLCLYKIVVLDKKK